MWPSRAAGARLTREGARDVERVKWSHPPPRRTAGPCQTLAPVDYVQDCLR